MFILDQFVLELVLPDAKCFVAAYHLVCCKNFANFLSVIKLSVNCVEELTTAHIHCFRWVWHRLCWKPLFEVAASLKANVSISEHHDRRSLPALIRHKIDIAKCVRTLNQRLENEV